MIKGLPEILYDIGCARARKGSTHSGLPVGLVDSGMAGGANCRIDVAAVGPADLEMRLTPSVSTKLGPLPVARIKVNDAAG